MDLPTQLAEKRRREVDKHFMHWTKRHLKDGVDDGLRYLSSLLATSAQPSANILKSLSQHHESGELFKTCCLQAVTFAANPFIPGLTLSVRLGAAAKQASEGDRRAMSDIQSSVDELLLEIFERLPQTVLGFRKGMDGCDEVFEPEFMRSSNDSSDLGGPLGMILSEKQQLETFCKVPLVMDYLSTKFTLGLPDLIDTTGSLQNKDQLRYLQGNGLFPDGIGIEISSLSRFLKDYAVVLLHGVQSPFPRTTPEHHTIDTPPSPTVLTGDQLIQPSPQRARPRHYSIDPPPSLTFLPGAQFILAGLVTAPTDYYEVPAVRMVLDFVVYVGMVATLSYFVLFRGTIASAPWDDRTVDRSFSSEEGACALVFITVRNFRTHGGHENNGLHFVALRTS